MDFYAVLDQIVSLLQQRGRVSYQALKRQFNLDDAYLDDLKIELIDAQQVARDDNGRVLVWVGEAAASLEGGATPARSAPEQPLQDVPSPPIAALPPDPRLPDAERRQLTVMFCDLPTPPPCLASSTPKTCGPCCAPISRRAPRSSSATRGILPSISVMACWCILAGLTPMKTTPSGRCMPPLSAVYADPVSTRNSTPCPCTLIGTRSTPPWAKRPLIRLTEGKCDLYPLRNRIAGEENEHPGCCMLHSIGAHGLVDCALVGAVRQDHPSHRYVRFVHGCHPGSHPLIWKCFPDSCNLHGFRHCNLLLDSSATARCCLYCNTNGAPRALTPPISRRPGHCWKNSGHKAALQREGRTSCGRRLRIVS